MRFPAFTRIAFVLIGASALLSAGCSRKIKDDLPPLNPRPGSLEFCIVANDFDDRDAFADAVAWFESAADSPEIQEDLKKRALEGQPPPPPEPKDGVPFIALEEKATYRWMEIGPMAIKELKLKSGSEPVPNREAVAQARAKGQVAIIRNYQAANAIWSRPCINKNLDEQQRADKEADFFILVRNAQPGKEITEAHLERFDPGVGSNNFRHNILAQLNPEGSSRMRELTSANRPTGIERQMAIIIQGEVLSMPNLKGTIADRFVIEGDFTKEYVEGIVRKVRTAGQ